MGKYVSDAPLISGLKDINGNDLIPEISLGYKQVKRLFDRSAYDTYYSNTSTYEGYQIVEVDGVLLLARPYVQKINKDSLEVVATSNTNMLSQANLTAGYKHVFRIVGDYLYYTTTNTMQLYKFNLSTLTLVSSRTHLGSNCFQFEISQDGLYALLHTGANSTNAVQKINLATMTISASFTTPNATRTIVVKGDYFYTLKETYNSTVATYYYSLQKYDVATGTLQASGSSGFYMASSWPLYTQPLIDGNYLYTVGYMTNTSSGNRGYQYCLYKFDLNTLEIVKAIPEPFWPSDLSSTYPKMYYGREIRKIGDCIVTSQGLSYNVITDEITEIDLTGIFKSATFQYSFSSNGDIHFINPDTREIVKCELVEKIKNYRSA